MKLVTRVQWEGMSPKTQGYVIYLQAELPGSELKGFSNPYMAHTRQHKDFCEGERWAILEIMDGEE